MVEKTRYPCPCGGKIEWKTNKIVVQEVDCEILDVEYCGKCGEEYLPEESMKIVEKKLKAAGLWGTNRKEATLWKSGSSVLLRIPKDIADTLNLKADERVTIYPEGKKRLVIDI